LARGHQGVLVNGTLYIVSTPIGNLEDITLRALRVLKDVDLIAAEDTRHSRKLLTHYGISKPLISYWGEREKVKSKEILERLSSGQSVALISDAGTPGISDPGVVLIRRAIEENIHVISIPGPSALIAALSLSGFPADEFIFVGFLPARKSLRMKILEELSLELRTLVFYEAPHRILETLTDMRDIFAERRAVVVKEITKIHEEAFRGTVPEVLASVGKTKIAGEYVIVIEERIMDKRTATEDVLSEVSALIRKGLSRKESVKKIAGIYGLSKKELYDKSLRETP
jgi:16S rRNA (cytidine1402-2'-O)-methyltransferase